MNQRKKAFEDLLREAAYEAQIAAAPTIGVIRPTIGRRSGDKVIHYEAKCRLCGAESEPDTISNTSDWLNGHLREKHRTEVLDHREVQPGTEAW